MPPGPVGRILADYLVDITPLTAHRDRLDRKEAHVRCGLSARTAKRRRTLASGVTVTTWVPLTRRTSLIRIGPPRHQYAADRVPAPVPQAGGFNRGCRAVDRWRLTAVTGLGLATRMAARAARSMRGACRAARLRAAAARAWMRSCSAAISSPAPYNRPASRPTSRLHTPGASARATPLRLYPILRAACTWVNSASCRRQAGHLRGGAHCAPAMP